MISELPYPIVSADGHMSEPPELYERLSTTVIGMAAGMGYFKRHGAVTISDDPVALRNLEMTGADYIMWGNDYPHDEGTYPHSRKYREQILAAAGPEDTNKIFVGNAARIYGFDERKLTDAA